MKKALFIVAFLPILSFGQISSNSDEISSSIVNYYLAKYAGNSEIRLEFSQSNESIELTSFSFEMGKPDIMNINESISIPKSSGFIKGDINGDLKEDVIVTTTIEFGASGSEHEIFIFVSDGNSLLFFGMYNSVDLSFCQQKGTYAGNFTPTLIKNAVIYGTSECFTSDDAHCCPSLNYNLEFIFNKGLVFKKQELKL